jgi:hypothetical protein
MSKHLYVGVSAQLELVPKITANARSTHDPTDFSCSLRDGSVGLRAYFKENTVLVNWNMRAIIRDEDRDWKIGSRPCLMVQYPEDEQYNRKHKKCKPLQPLRDLFAFLALVLADRIFVVCHFRKILPMHR